MASGRTYHLQDAVCCHSISDAGLYPESLMPIYSYGGSEEAVESRRRNTDQIVRSNRGRTVEDKQVIDAYSRSKTGLRGLPSIWDSTS